MKTSSKYKEFVKEVIEPLKTDDVRQDEQKVKKILVDFFAQRQFTVYSFVHEYFHNQLEEDDHGEVVAQLNCIMEVVKRTLSKLITEFEDKSCEENEIIEEISCSCEDESCEYKRIGNLEKSLSNQCSCRNEWYHIIRRIAKFYENLHSVDNLISSNENAQREYEKTSSSIEDMKALMDDALQQFSENYDVINTDYHKEVQSFNDRIEKLSGRMEMVRGEFSTAIISVMSIFAAAILATIVPMNFLNAVAKQIFIHEWGVDATPVLIFIFILFIMFNLIYFLLSYVATITLGDRCNEKFESKRKLVKWIDAVMLLIIAILLIVVVF